MNKDLYLRRESQISGADSLKDCLKAVDFNPSELCNRRCSFCPRTDKNVYPNRSLFLQKPVSLAVAEGLAGMKFRGRISFGGFGEPLLHKSLAEHIRIMRDHLAEASIEITTNGDFLTEDLARELVGAG